MSVASGWKLATALTLACWLQAQDTTSAGPPSATTPPASGHETTLSTASPQELTDTSPGVTPGKLIRKLDPKYPSKAERGGVEGTVVLAATITKDGEVKDVRLISGDPLLAEAAVSAVRHWRYTPYMFEGRRVEIRTQLSLTFVLHRSEHNCQEEQKTISASGAEDLATSPDASGDSGKADAPQEIYRVGDGVKPPRPISSPDPDYPERARKARERGTVVLWATITPEGKVKTVRVARSIGPDLDDKAIEAVCQWKFQPATRDGKPVAVQINIEVGFWLY
jgi:TonB family protein